MNYHPIKCHCSTMISAIHKLRLYLLLKSNPLKYLITLSPMLGCITQSLLQLTEFDVIVVTPSGLRIRPYLIYYNNSLVKSINLYVKI